MALHELRILPPLAVARLGSSATPLEAFELEVDEKNPMGFRKIVPATSFEIDEATGAIARAFIPPAPLRFRDGEAIRPVAPFLELFARTDDDTLDPVTLEMLAHEGLSPADIRWSVELGNIKIFRRTGDPNDRIVADARDFSDHEIHALHGQCNNFVTGKTLPLGTVRYIRPSQEHPEIRLRFTPAAGKVYGASNKRQTSDDPKSEVADPVFEPEHIIYDPHRGRWRGHAESGGPTLTNPGQIFAGYDSPTRGRVSWGYFDDECDGIVTATLTLKDGRILTAQAHIGAGPPAFAPDSLPIRTVADELEQLVLGPSLAADEEVPIAVAEEIVRRALETVRLMNTAVMNGNTIDGRTNIASTMVRQDTNDAGRWFEPIMAPSLVDNLAVLALHQRVFAVLRGGSAPWFADALRRPEDIGDLSGDGRRKMPSMMRGADGRALTLTRRQIAQVIQAATRALFQGPATGDSQ